MEKYINESTTRKGITYQVKTREITSKRFELLMDAIRWRDHYLAEGEALDIPTIDPYGDKYISHKHNSWVVQITINRKTSYPCSASTISLAKIRRNEFLGMSEETCSVCGRKYWAKFPDTICNNCYEPNAEEHKEYKLRIGRPELIEKEARKVGLHYADIQKQKTLNLLKNYESITM